MTAKRKFKKTDQRKEDPRFSKEARKTANEMLDKCKDIAADHDISLAQLAIAWACNHSDCIHALVGARDREQAIENARAGDVRFNDDEMETMNALIKEYAEHIPGSEL
jgi:aryl-alcohol dehydrogenase-like predicted oxidoreductase